jgi:RNA polymerase sigma-70 factor, ECF subfamily
MNLSDKNIIQRIKKGDSDVFKIIFDLYYQRIRLYAESYVDDADVAEDIVQDLFFHLWEKRFEIEVVTSFSSYMYKAIHNRCIQYLRHRKIVTRFQERHLLKIKEAEILQSETDFAINDVYIKEITDIENRILSALSPKTKKIFHLSRYEYKKNQEIAVTLNTNVKTVEYHITKALKSLQLALKDYILF